MTTSTSLIDLLLSLLRDPQAVAAYKEDPEGFLSSCGDVSPDDIHDALLLLQDSQDADYSRDYNTGGNHVHVPPPPPVHHGNGGNGGNGGDGGHDDGDHEAAVRYLNTYITNNNIDDRDTIVDNSVNQQIDTGGGDFDQDIDVDSTVASGDGAVAAGGDIEDSTVVTGDDNQVGDGNIRGDGNVVGDGNDVISGDGNTAAFGNGDANSASFEDVDVSSGGAVSVGGDATGEYDVDDSFNETTTTNTSNTEFEDSFNQDNDSATDSYNETSTETETDSHDEIHNDTLSHNNVDVDS